MGVLRVAAIVGMTALAGLVDACGGRAGGNAEQSGGSGVAGAASGGEDQEQAGATPGFGEAGGRQDATGGSIGAGGGTLFIGGAGEGGADGNVATGGGAGHDASASENGGGAGGAVETLRATGGASQGSGGRSCVPSLMDAHQSEHLSCNVPVPDLGPGLPLDHATLGLNFVHGDGSTESLPHDDSCAGPGWHYDSPSTPTHFVLCPETCDVAQADAKGAFEVVFGCSSW